MSVELSGDLRVLYLIGLFVSVVFLAGIGLVVSRHRHLPAIRPLLVTILGCGIWSVAWGIQVLLASISSVLTASDPLYVGLQTVEYLAIYAVISGVLLFSLEFTGRERFVTRRLLFALCVVPTVVGVAILTSPHHGFWESTIPGGESVENPGFLLHAPYAYALLLTSFVILTVFLLRSNTVFRRQGTLVIPAMALPTLGDLSYVTGTVPSPFYPTPVAFTFSSLLFFLAVRRYRFGAVLPVARRTVLENMNQGLLVLDGNDRVTQSNHSFGVMTGVDREGVIGTHVFDALPPDTSIGAAFEDLLDADSERSQSVELDGRHLSIAVSPLVDERGRTIGRLFLLSDVTERKRREYQLERSKRRLEERGEKLDLMRQVFARVLRHNLRNELSVVQLSAEAIAEDAPEPYRSHAEMILDRSNELLSTSEKARTVETVVDEAVGACRFDACEVVATTVQQLEDAFERATIELDCSPDTAVIAHESFPLAIECVVENSIVHHDDDPWVSVTVERADDVVVIDVIDDGPGIPAHELSVLEAGRETAMHHGSGAGLWVANLVIEESNGSIEFDRSDGLTAVRMTLPVSTAS